MVEEEAPRVGSKRRLPAEAAAGGDRLEGEAGGGGGQSASVSSSASSAPPAAKRQATGNGDRQATGNDDRQATGNDGRRSHHDCQHEGCRQLIKSLQEEVARLKQRLKESIPICAICLDDVKYPVELSECRHIFCCQCIYSTIMHEPSREVQRQCGCPVCRTPMNGPPVPPPLAFIQHLDRVKAEHERESLSAPQAVSGEQQGKSEGGGGGGGNVDSPRPSPPSSPSRAADAAKQKRIDRETYQLQMDQLKEIFAVEAGGGGRDDAMYDEGDHVYRCPRCHWETVDGRCQGCGWRAGDAVDLEEEEDDDRDRYDEEEGDRSGSEGGRSYERGRSPPRHRRAVYSDDDDFSYDGGQGGRGSDSDSRGDEEGDRSESEDGRRGGYGGRQRRLPSRSDDDFSYDGGHGGRGSDYDSQGQEEEDRSGSEGGWSRRRESPRRRMHSDDDDFSDDVGHGGHDDDEYDDEYEGVAVDDDHLHGRLRHHQAQEELEDEDEMHSRHDGYDDEDRDADLYDEDSRVYDDDGRYDGHDEARYEDESGY